MAAFAFVTLVSSDDYLNGALVQAAALRDVHPDPPAPPELPFQTVCLVTPESVNVATVRQLRKAFDLVVGVEILEQDNPAGLKLLGRPDLTTVLTKLHVFRLTQFQKIIFLDADVLPIRPMSHLFSLSHDFSAAPDVGWPDIFNSGVLVLSPGQEKFDQLNHLIATKHSWDGGDQGLLNEWRDGDWNRLSFTYNTTPTAAYTYAPAYERYGSQIKAIHFIGPNKPWKSVPYRAPFSGRHSDDSVQTAYDYDSLVDRWFDVYNRHYNTIVPQTPFQVKHYTAAWEQPSTEPPHTLDLDELKRLAIQGLNASAEDVHPGEGAYKTLPIQGRFDLMRPRKPEPEMDHKQPAINPKTDQWLQPVEAYIQPEEPRWRTLPTPGPNEVPSSPLLRSIALPPTPSLPHQHRQEHHQEQQQYHHQEHHHQEHHHQEHHPQEHHPQEQQHQHPQEAPKRPISPPMMAWNPAIEPPPKAAPTPNAFPADTYFANVWDHTPSRQNDQSHPGPSPPDSGGFFQPPPPPVIPDSLIKQGHYRNVTGEAHMGATPSPDRSKIKTVFPWEGKPRVLPRRVFPDSDAPPPSLFLSPGSQSQASTTTPSTPETKDPSILPTRGVTLSPLYGLPDTLNYANAWDNIPSIQKYASRLVKPPPPPPTTLAPAFEDEAYNRKSRKKSWDERMEVSSRDGDDEDNADEDEDEAPVQNKWDDDSDRESAKRRSRRGSIVNPNVLKGRKKEYRTRGVQTNITEKRNMAVQADPPPPPPPPTRSEPTTARLKRGSMSSRKHWAPATASTVLAPTTTRDVSTGGHGLSLNTVQQHQPAQQRKKSPSVSPGFSPMRSPREFVVPPPTIVTPPLSMPFARPPSSTRLSPTSIARRASNDSSLGSPASSFGPVSPAEGQAVLSPARKGTRVWDPARGVELFKRGSEEVLARFLKMGAWEDESR
ncbi:hypothetical protein GALMADRAFT_54016 [Galerina marginata CBS 339.88]|uniref:glycogenin glucosyltransferase n=1 Tax=Galerina marginata (strain CBS 339.88) TaxID=685588 RepID=A0A067TQM1_GALM3|nr:hypothetical protein GALMADRAFT_54016 [Galerina marginata CBS 339.88]